MTLVFVSYTYDVNVLATSVEPPENVMVRGNTWYYLQGTAHQESYTIGEGVRELSTDGELFGPIFVFDLENPVHAAKYGRILTELAEHHKLVTV
jgi:hypothetical protein